jgi:hypothetical protein
MNFDLPKLTAGTIITNCTKGGRIGDIAWGVSKNGNVGSKEVGVCKLPKYLISRNEENGYSIYIDGERVLQSDCRGIWGDTFSTIKEAKHIFSINVFIIARAQESDAAATAAAEKMELDIMNG